MEALSAARLGREATLLYSAPLEGMGLSGLRVNPEQAPAFMPGSRGVDMGPLLGYIETRDQEHDDAPRPR